MAQICDPKIIFEVSLSISEETADMCCRLLSMYFNEHTDKYISLDEIEKDDRYERKVSIV